MPWHSFANLPGGGTVSQRLRIADNALSANTGYGLFVKADGYQFGFVTQTGSVTGNTIADNRFGRAGAIFHASGRQASGAVQTLSLLSGSGNHIVGNAGSGVFLYALVPASQTFNINGNDVSGNNGGGSQTVVIGTGVINP